MRMLLLAAFISLFYCSCSHNGVNVNDQVIKVIRNYEDAVNNPNPELWLSLWDLEYDDLTILENDKHQVLGRQYIKHIADWMKTATPEKRQTWHTNKVYIMNKDLAYTVSMRTEHTTPEDQRESRITLLMRRTNGKWKIIHCHFSFVPD